MVTLRSPHPHARVAASIPRDAEKFPGVAMVLHRFNLPREYQRIKLGSGPPDRLLFPEEVFMVGAPVAIVLADSQDIGDEAMRLIKVEYEILPAAVNFLEAMKPGAPKQWDNQLDGTIVGVSKPFQRGDPKALRVGRSQGRPRRHQAGRAARRARADQQRDVVGKRPPEHVLHQPGRAQRARGAVVGAATADELRCASCQQGYVGSGYGYRGSIDLPEIHAAIAAKITGRPIKNVYTRYEDFATRTHRPHVPQRDQARRVNKDGTIVAVRPRSSPTSARSARPPRRAPGTTSRCCTRSRT